MLVMVYSTLFVQQMVGQVVGTCAMPFREVNVIEGPLADFLTGTGMTLMVAGADWVKDKLMVFATLSNPAIVLVARVVAFYTNKEMFLRTLNPKFATLFNRDTVSTVKHASLITLFIANYRTMRL